MVDWSIHFEWTRSFKNAPMWGVGRPNKICKTHITTKSKSNFAVMELVGLGLFFFTNFYLAKQQQRNNAEDNAHQLILHPS